MAVRLDTAKLDAIIRTAPGNRDKIVGEAAFHVLGNGRAKAPVRTGWLRDNSDVEHNGPTADINFRAGYAAYVELGTYKMAAQPFLTPAIEAERQHFIELLKGGLIK